MTELVTIYRPDGSSETLRADLARNRTYLAPDEWSMVKPPPLGWERTVPKYLVTRDLRPSPNSRHKMESPFSEIWQSDIWQQADRQYAAGETVESTAWPHASMQGLNYSAERVLEFFKASMKSRLQVSPWFAGQVRLSDGISGPLPSVVQTPRPEPMRLRPVA